MAASVSGSKTVSNKVSPAMTGASLTTLLAIAVENLTVAQLETIRAALKRVSKGTAPNTVIGSVLN